MEYPYIGKGKHSESNVLFIKNNTGIPLDNMGLVATKGIFRDDFKEGEFKNVTREYLEGKSVKIESPEHSEFIINICESNDIAVAKKHLNCAFIVFCGGGMLFCDAPHNSYKQITIPLPPKAEPKLKEWPQIGDEVVASVGVGVVKLLADNNGHFVVDFGDYGYSLYTIKQLSEPKTEAEILRDELYECITDYSSSESLIDDLINKFNITKKV